MTMLKFRAGLAIAGGIAVCAFIVFIGLPAGFLLGLIGALLGMLHINFVSDISHCIMDKIILYTRRLTKRLRRLSNELEQAKTQ